jgi:hypothetical protein
MRGDFVGGQLKIVVLQCVMLVIDGFSLRKIKVESDSLAEASS